MQEYVLDLSISLRTGKETNLDFFSSGERTRMSSNGNAKLYLEWSNPMERGAKDGDSPCDDIDGRVVLFGNAV